MAYLYCISLLRAPRCDAEHINNNEVLTVHLTEAADTNAFRGGCPWLTPTHPMVEYLTVQPKVYVHVCAYLYL